MGRLDMTTNGCATFRKFVSNGKHGCILHQGHHHRSCQNWHIPRANSYGSNIVCNSQFARMFQSNFYHIFINNPNCWHKSTENRAEMSNFALNYNKV